LFDIGKLTDTEQIRFAGWGIRFLRAGFNIDYFSHWKKLLI
jgi:hypothetical protein